MSRVIVTGHSFSGGVAGIVGALNKIRAVTFSAPGLIMSRGKFGIHRIDIDTYLTNVIPHHDLITQIDKQGGTSIVLPCDGSAYHCHALSTSICTLLNNNGQPNYVHIRRNLNNFCETLRGPIL